MIVVPASASLKLAGRIAKSGGFSKANVVKKTFPDGELYVRVEGILRGNDVLVVGSTASSDSILELLLLMDAVLECRPRSLRCLIPYFGYSRQHKRYNEGEPVSSKAITMALDRFADSIMTIDIHDEQTLGYSSKPFSNIRIEKPVGDFFASRHIDYVLAPDDGAAAKARAVAKLLGARSAHLDKKRVDSNTVEMMLPRINVKGKNVLLVDDMISGGGTIMKATKLLRGAGAKKVYAFAVHGVFANGSDAKISAVVDGLAVTDTIESRFSKISVAETVLRHLKQ